jgi:outer membrane protein OmpA-like peptidoglycan-associated protein
LPPSTVPETLPDGRPVPATIVFADDQVTLSGAVPSAEAADRLAAFATDYRLTAAPVVNELTIDPTVPASGGVRVVEFNSINFVGDDNVISPEHAQQIERVVAAMEADPQVTVHVVGNTDQQGDETRNFVVSQRRAEAVVGYLVSEGIDPARLTTQPAGATNPLRTDATPEADAINRRVDFVFYGLLGA